MAHINLSDQSNELPGRRFQKTYTGGTAGEWVILDSAEPGDTVSVGLVMATGVGYIQFTADSVASVIDGTAIPVTWGSGSVSVPTIDFFPSSVTAVRAYYTSGTIRLVISR